MVNLTMPLLGLHRDIGHRHAAWVVAEAPTAVTSSLGYVAPDDFALAQVVSGGLCEQSVLAG